MVAEHQHRMLANGPLDLGKGVASSSLGKRRRPGEDAPCDGQPEDVVLVDFSVDYVF